MIKVIASDMDGTILNRKHRLSERNALAIKKAEEKGIQFMFATGRDYSGVAGIMEERRIRCACILLNGAEIRDEDGNVIQTFEMKKEKIKEAIAVLDRYGVVVNFMTGEGIAVLRTEEEVKRDILERLEIMAPDEKPADREKVAEFFVKCQYRYYPSHLEKLLTEEASIKKLEAFCKDSALVEKINQELKQIEGIAVASAGPYSIEVTDEKANKGRALDQYVREKGIKKEEVVVFGDSLNDYSLFSLFPRSYAPANAMEAIKKMAHGIVASNQEDGVGNAILELIKDD